MAEVVNDQAAMMRMVVFTLGAEYYGVDASVVQEIRRLETITPIPRTPDYLLGVVNLRSQVVPVMCLRRRFGLPVTEMGKSTRIIVVEVQGTKVGILVDAVLEVAKLSEHDVDQAPPAIAEKGEFIAGVCRYDRALLVMLDIKALLPGKGMEQVANEVQG